MLVGVVIVFGYILINVIVKVEFFLVEIWVLGVGLLYGLIVVIFGGIVNYVVFWLCFVYLESGFFWYVFGIVFILFLVYIFMIKKGVLVLDKD